MADCLSLIDTNADLKDIACWANASQMTNVIHTETVQILSCASGYLEIEPFCVIDTDCRIVKAMIYHDCDTGKIQGWTEVVICHLFQSGPDTLVKLDCWELVTKPYAASPEICWNSDPCARRDELRCCLMERKDGIKTSWSFRDASGSTKHISEATLMRLISEADSECDYQCGRNTRCISYSCPTC